MGVMKSLGKPGEESPYLVLRVPKDMKAELEELAAKDRRSLSDYVRLVLEDHLAAKKKRK